PEGIPIALPVILAGLGLAAIGFRVLGSSLVIIGAAMAAFFRDPERCATASADAVVSGADGRVCEIGAASLPGSREQALRTRISVFMSPLDVHVNRAPVSGD